MSTSRAPAEVPADGESALATPSDDDALARAIRDRFRADPILRRENVGVAVSDGAVTLEGPVSSPAAGRRAVELVEDSKGPLLLFDRTILTLPPSRADVDLARDVSRTLKADRAARGAHVKAVASSGKVKLEGTAESWAQRQLLGELTRRVPGVSHVDNALTILAVGAGSDADIDAELRDRLAYDGRLDGAHVTHETHGRDVRLKGVVASIAQKQAATDDAWAAGAANVDAGGVAIDWRRNETMPAPPRPNGDAPLAAAVRRALRDDPRVGITEPSVAVTNGVVTLGGDASDRAAVDSAVDDASQVLGVRRVESRVRVLPSGHESDATIQREVERTVLNDLAAPDSVGVQITTLHGKVTLRGNVRSLQERNVVEGDVLSVPGVLDIANDLEVQPSGEELSPPARQELHERVIEALFWDPHVDHRSVSVTVGPDRSVTLTGTVRSWNAARAAEADAVRAGAARIENRLGVSDDQSAGK